MTLADTRTNGDLCISPMRLRGSLRRSRTLAPMRWLVLFFVVLLLIGGGLRLAGQQIPILDYPFGGPMGQPQIQVVEPDLKLP